jgi:hypothetical protein
MLLMIITAAGWAMLRLARRLGAGSQEPAVERPAS